MNHNTKILARTLHTNQKSNHRRQYYFCVSITTLLCLTAITNFANATDYHVATDGNDDTGTGAIGLPWKTISYAMSAASPVTAGDTVLVRAGTYRETVTIEKNGTNGNPVIIKAYSGETVIMDGSSILSNGWTQCTSNEPGLTVLGVTNANYANIYKTIVSDSLLAADPLVLGREPLVFDGNTRKKLASQPTQTSSWGTDVTEFTALEEEAWNHSDGSANSPDVGCTPAAENSCGVYSYLIDSDGLTQLDNYWNDAYIDIFLVAANSAVIRRKISDYDQSDHKILFDSLLTDRIWYGAEPDAFIIVNHPHVIDAEDEYLLFDNEDGTHSLYLYSTELPVDISVINLPRAFLIRSNGNYINIEDITMRFYYYGCDVDAPDDGSHIQSFNVKNCTITNTAGHGLSMYDVDNSTIDNCTISYTNTSGRGVRMVNGTGNCVKNCTISNTSSTNIGFSTQIKSSIIYNNLSGYLGDHGNGISCYDDCENILVAGNFLPRANIALKNINGAIVFNNCLLGDETLPDVVGFWGGTVEGDFLFFHNTLLAASTNGALSLLDSSSGNIYVANNILDGLSLWEYSDVTTHNLYTGLHWKQKAGFGWAFGTGESLEATLDNIFTDYDIDDCSLVGGGPAINVGTDISAYLTQARIDFPNYDFDKDIAGNARSIGTTDMGAYEYTGPYFNPTIGDKSVDEEATLSFIVSATDPDGDPITYGATGTAIDAGASFDAGTRAFSWTPNNTQSGTYQATFTATAGGQTFPETITITVNNINVERTLTINSTLGGSVTTPGEGTLQYDHGSSVAIAATASANYSFVNWTGTAVDAGTVANANAASTTVTADADYTLFANFTIDQRTVTISSSAGGSVTTPGEGAFQYNHGTSVLIQASPQANYEFVNWTGTAVDAGKVANVNAADTTVTADAAYTLVANFSLVQRTLTISSSSYGSVTTPGEGDLPYDHGTVVPIVATPSGNNYFVNWTGTAVDAGKVANANAASTTVTADSDYTLVANFAEEDLIAPTLTNLSPADADVQVSIDSLIILTIADAGIGVDLDTVTIDVEGDRIYDGGSETSEGVYDSTGNAQTVKGICRRTGTSSAYSFFFQADARFDYEKNITVTVNASDLASTSNDMAEQSYSFYTVMREFEGNAKVNSDTGTLVQDRPAVAKDSDGNIWAVWDQTTIAGDTDIYIGKLAVNDSTFGESTQVTSDTNNQRNAVIAIASNNKIYLAWQDYRQGEWDIYLTTSMDGENFSTETRITDPNSNQINPNIAIDSSDKVYIAWEDDQNSNNDIYIASSTNSFASKTTSQITSNASSQTSPAIAIDSAKTVYVVWTDARNASNDIYGASSTSGPWTNAAIVNNANGQTSPVIATETSGTVLHLLWVDDTSGNDDIFYGATTGGLAGLPLTGTDVSDDTTSSDQSNPSIFATGTTGSDLRVFACWKDSRDVVNNNADTDIYYGETALGSSTFGTNILVNDDSGTNTQSVPVVDVDINGNPYLAWVDNRGGNKDIYYAGAMLIGPVLVSKLVTREDGGTVEVNSDTENIIDDATDVRVVIPELALPADTTITISELINPPSPPLGGFGVNYEFGPSGLVFDSPVTIYLPHAAADCPGHAIYRVYWYNLELSAWYPPGGIAAQHGVDPVYGVHYITFETDHFTGFGVGGGAAGGGGGGGGGCSMSPDGKGTIVEFLVPYIGLAIVMATMKLKGRRKKNLHRYTDSD